MTWPNVVTLIGSILAVMVPILAFIRSGKSERATRVDRVEAQVRALEDYCYLLRRNMEQAGVEVPPWPDALNKHGD